MGHSPYWGYPVRFDPSSPHDRHHPPTYNLQYHYNRYSVYVYSEYPNYSIIMYSEYRSCTACSRWVGGTSCTDLIVLAGLVVSMVPSSCVGRRQDPDNTYNLRRYYRYYSP